MKLEDRESVAVGFPELCDNKTLKAKCKYSMYQAHGFVFPVKDTLITFCYLMNYHFCFLEINTMLFEAEI